jgi:tRNA 5-methylaminomethyl-2-thiouridine biosynthesis bifunctional protein
MTLLCTPPDLVWTEHGPRAPGFDDVYFSAEDGLAEARAVFLQGCGLPEAWRGRRVFTVGELGFGTGLNALALWDLWRREGPADGWLHLVSIEKHPLRAEDAARAFAAWPELADLGAKLAAAWPPAFKGAHRLRFDEDRFSITLFQDDVETAIGEIDASVDAWFLDGFAPSRNPAMWSDAVMAGVGRLSAKGARAATFTVAGAVRRALQAAGFAVEKKPGFGRKRERLETVFQGEPAGQEALGGRIAILGAGIAGASLAHALSARGREVVLVDPAGPAGGASGAPAGLLTPRLEKADRPHQRVCLAAFAQARRLYDGRDGFHPEGALRLAKDEKEAERFRILADWMGEGFDWDEARGGLWMAPAGRFEPAELVRGLIGPVPVVDAAPAEGEIVIDARGHRVDFADMTPSAGRVGVFAGEALEHPLVWGGYACAAPGGVLVGASHVKGEASGEKTAELAGFRDAYGEIGAGSLGEAVSDWSGVRATTPERLPVAGETAPGHFILSGLGARGFAHAPLLAELIASRICGEPSPLERAGAGALAPGRFEARRKRRSG